MAHPRLVNDAKPIEEADQSISDASYCLCASVKVFVVRKEVKRGRGVDEGKMRYG